MEQARIFEHDGHWLIKRPDTDKYSIAWWPGGAGCRRIRRAATGTADLEEAKRRLIEFAAANRSTADSTPLIATRAPFRQESSPEKHAGVARVSSAPGVLMLLCDYVDWLKGRRSYNNALDVLKCWSAYCRIADIVELSDLTLDAQERYVAWRRREIVNRGWSGSNSTLIRELGVLKAALRHAWKRGRIASVPYVVTLAAPPPQDRFFTVEEVKRLLAECHQPHLRLFVLLALHTLQRPCAILGLKVSQVDFSSNRIDFLPPGAVQSKKRKPMVPITATLRPALEAAVRDSLSGFVVEWEGKPVKSVRTTFSKACKRAGLDDVHPYVLRHTGPTLLAAAGVPMRQIAGMLGHTHDRTTELYAKHRPEFLRDASHKLDELFGEDENVSAPECAPNCAPECAPVMGS